MHREGRRERAWFYADGRLSAPVGRGAGVGRVFVSGENSRGVRCAPKRRNDLRKKANAERLRETRVV